MTTHRNYIEILSILIIFCFSLQAQDGQVPLLKWPEIDEASFTESPLYTNLMTMPFNKRRKTCELFVEQLTKDYAQIRNYAIVALLAYDCDTINNSNNPVSLILAKNDVPLLKLCSQKTNLLELTQLYRKQFAVDASKCLSMSAAQICLKHNFSLYSLSTAHLSSRNSLYRYRDVKELETNLPLIAYLLHHNQLLATGIGEYSNAHTPLQIAANAGNISLIKLLLRYGAPPDQKRIPQNESQALEQLNPVDYPVYLGDIPEIMGGEQFVDAPTPAALNPDVLDKESFTTKISSLIQSKYDARFMYVRRLLI